MTKEQRLWRNLGIICCGALAVGAALYAGDNLYEYLTISNAPHPAPPPPPPPGKYLGYPGLIVVKDFAAEALNNTLVGAFTALGSAIMTFILSKIKGK